MITWIFWHIFLDHGLCLIGIFHKTHQGTWSSMRTVCCNKFSNSSIVNPASFWGAAAAVSKACHNFDRSPMTSIFFYEICQKWCLMYKLAVIFLQKMRHKLIKFFYFNEIWWSRIFCQYWILDIFIFDARMKMWDNIWCHVSWQDSH